MSLLFAKRIVILGGISFVLSGCSVMHNISSAVGIKLPKKEVAQGSVEPNDTQGYDEETQQVFDIAEATYNRGDYRTAIGLYQRVFELNPDNPEPMLRIGAILNKKGEPLAAGQAYRQVLAVDPVNLEAKRGLGLSFLTRGQMDLAIEQFSEGLAIEKTPKLLNAMGVAYDKKGERQTAQKYYKEGLDIDKSNLTLQSNYGLSMSYEGRHDEALAVLYPLSKNPKATVQHRQILAMAYTLSGDLDAAEQTSRIDMDDADVAKRMRYFNSLTPTKFNSSSLAENDHTIRKEAQSPIENIESETIQ
ncbi:tetratricopeptide repeat protein [Kiloniella majae]|uniref:tetratricopeptide repeat protein n=1 Tax=Kiloniella majae TaxID=1938558 RepID=UPI000A2781FA|nr:tetratricopeptide repeat protein [Kiloniella majae]